MPRIWRYIYLIWAVLWITSGYRMLAPDQTADFKIDWFVIVGGFLLFCIVPLASTALKCRFGVEMTFRRPSLDRAPFRRCDPLQTMRLFVATSTLMSVGACFALPNADQHGLMMFWATAAMSMGLFVGERLIYWVYAKRIV